MSISFKKDEMINFHQPRDGKRYGTRNKNAKLCLNNSETQVLEQNVNITVYYHTEIIAGSV